MESSVKLSPERALELAQEFLGGNWNLVTANDVQITPLRGGVCSTLFIIDSTSKAVQCDPSRFLIRFYVGLGALEENDPMVTLNIESQVLLFYKFGVDGNGPKLFGSFKDGRLEEFIPSTRFLDHHLHDRDLRLGLARKMARYHNVDLPLTSKCLDHYSQFEKGYLMFDNDKGRAKFVKACAVRNIETEWALNYDWRKEIEWMRQTERKVPTRNVLCNNDVNRNNALVLETPDQFGERVMLIDYELSSMNPRGLDIGHHFAMWMIDFSDFGKDTFISTVDYPSLELRTEFIREYLNETRKLVRFELDPELDSIEHLLFEAHFYGMKIVHFWISTFLFGSDEGILADPAFYVKTIEVAKKFFEFYFEQKKQLLAEHPELS